MRILRASVFMGLFVLTLSATTSLYDNVSQQVVDCYSVTGDGPLYASFSTGATGFSLTNVEIDLANDDDLEFGGPIAIDQKPNIKGRSHSMASAAGRTRPKLKIHPDPAAPGGSITVALYANNANSPGGQLTLIATLPDASLPTGPSGGLVNFVLGTAYPLAANTRYWIGISTSNDSLADWLETNTSAGTGVVNEFLYADDTVFANANAAVNEPFIMQVDGNATPAVTATPVPPSLILGLIGLAFVGLYFGRGRFAFRRNA